MQVTCDGCGLLTDIKIQNKRNKDLYYSYFKCSHCKKIHMVSCTDSSLRDRIKQYRELQTKIYKSKNPVNRIRMAEEAARMNRENIRMAKELEQMHPFGEG